MHAYTPHRQAGDCDLGRWNMACQSPSREFFKNSGSERPLRSPSGSIRSKRDRPHRTDTGEDRLTNRPRRWRGGIAVGPTHWNVLGRSTSRRQGLDQRRPVTHYGDFQSLSCQRLPLYHHGVRPADVLGRQPQLVLVYGDGRAQSELPRLPGTSKVIARGRSSKTLRLLDCVAQVAGLLIPARRLGRRPPVAANGRGPQRSCRGSPKVQGFSPFACPV
jgi:hypothetical protein